MSNEEIFVLSPITDRHINSMSFPEKIIHVVGKHLSISPFKIRSKSKERKIARARAYSIYFIWKFTTLKQEDIVLYFEGGSKTGKKERSLVTWCKIQINKRMTNDPETKVNCYGFISRNRIFNSFVTNGRNCIN